MNYIIPANLSTPIYPDQPVTRPVVAIASSSSEFSDTAKQQPSTYVYRGEILEAVANERHYWPHYNLPANTLNQRAILSYQKVAEERQNLGQILNGFI